MNTEAVFTNVLTCVQRLAKLLLTEAGVLGGPSEQCVNAVIYIMQFSRDYHAVFENLATHLDRVGACLERLKL